MEKPLIIVLARNYSNGLAVIRSLGCLGYTIDLIGSAFKEGELEIAASSKYVRNFSEVVSKKVKADTNDEALIEKLMEYADTYDIKPVVIPTDDYTTSIMDINRDILKDHFVLPSLKDGKACDLVNLMDKQTQAEYAKKVGLKVAKSWRISLRGDICIPDDMVYPCFVKPIQSIKGYKTEMEICHDLEALQAHLGKLKDAFSERDIFVQEFLEIDQEIASAGLCQDEHIVLPGVIKKGAVGKHGRGVTLIGTLIPFEELGQDIVDKATKLLQSFHYTGLFGMEFNIVNGEVYFNEVNLRSAGEGFAYFKDGCNLPELYLKGLENIPATKEEEQLDTYGVNFIYDKIAWEDYVYDNITKEELDAYIASSDYAILCNDDDPRPGELFIQKYVEMKERKDKTKQLRQDCITATMEATSWDEETTIKHMDATRACTSVTYKEYVKLKLYDTTIDMVEEEYTKRVEKRERIKQNRLDCIAATVEATGWDEETAIQNIKECRDKTGVSYKDYIKFKLYDVAPENQEAEYKKQMEKREKTKQLREECIAATMKSTGWDEAKAKQHILAARKLTGISFKDYTKYNFYKIDPANQEEEYKKIVAHKKQQEKIKNDCIKATMAATGWDEDKAKKKIASARKLTGISYKQYVKYEFYKVAPDKQEAAYKKILKDIKNKKK